ncbi:MAG: hypothetical protein PHZ00_07415 [Candidatus Peribacteraceae bacterium]|nr:hypothetical protein [Candidatus Peribacteraceae bacterium]
MSEFPTSTAGLKQHEEHSDGATQVDPMTLRPTDPRRTKHVELHPEVAEAGLMEVFLGYFPRKSS